MRSGKTQYKNQNRLFFCNLCPFIANSEEELEHHYKMAHSSSDEDEVFFEERAEKLEDGTILIHIPGLPTCIKYPDGRFEC